MSDIPEARAQLLALAKDLHPAIAREIRRIVGNYMIRETPIKVTRVKSNPVDAKTARHMRRYAARYPQRSNQEIANHFGVNPGRVSEALNGLR